MFIISCILLNRILRNIGLDDGQVFVDFYDWSNDRYVHVIHNTASIKTFASSTVLKLRQNSSGNSTEVEIPRNYLANLTYVRDPFYFKPVDKTLRERSSSQTD